MLVLQDFHPTPGIEEKRIILIHLLHQTTVHHTAGNLQVLALSPVHELGYSLGSSRLVCSHISRTNTQRTDTWNYERYSAINSTLRRHVQSGSQTLLHLSGLYILNIGCLWGEARFVQGQQEVATAVHDGARAACHCLVGFTMRYDALLEA